VTTRGARGAAALALATGLAAGCSTTHQPRPDPRIGLVIRNGGAYYVKDGQLTNVGPFGGDLERLVAVSPEAARLAHRGHIELAVGVPLYLIGFAGVFATLAMVQNDARWPLVATGGVVTFGGLTLMGAGFTNVLDAVNAHNDTVAGSADREHP
jgi:hypothetical protein